MRPPPIGAQSYFLPFFTTSLQWQWPMRSVGRSLYPSGYGISPLAAALPGSQFNMNADDCTWLSTLAASAPVAVLHAGSFSRTRIIFFLASFSAAARSLSFMAARYGA